MNEDFYTLDYRRSQLEQELDKIREAVSGREISFLSRITDGEGKRDPDKIEALINAMIDSYNEYQKVWGAVHSENIQPAVGEARDLFHHLLYLAIVGPGGESYQDLYSYCTNIILLKSEKYSDILKNVKRLEFFKDKAEMYDAEAYFKNYYYEGCPSWTDFLNFTFYRIEERPITETYTLSPEEWDPNNRWGLWSTPPKKEKSEDTENEGEESPDPENAASEEKTDQSSPDSETKMVTVELAPGVEVQMRVHQMTEEELAYEKYVSQFEMKNEDEDYDKSEIPPMTQEEYDQWEKETMERILEENEEEDKYYKDWLDTVPDAKVFCRIYLEFREMIVKPELKDHLKNVAKEIEMLLDAWLFHLGESPYALGDSYSLVSARLQNTTAHLMRELDRARRLK